MISPPQFFVALSGSAHIAFHALLKYNLGGQTAHFRMGRSTSRTMARNPRLEHVKAKVKTRGDVRDVGVTYLSRLYPIVYHMHEVLRLHVGDDTSVSTSIRQYVIALAAHLETFFRDVVRFAVERDTSAFERIVHEHHLRVPSVRDLASAGVTAFDFVAEAFTLQSAGSVAGALDSFFLPSGFRVAVERTSLPYAIPSRSARTRGFPITAFPNWFDDLAQIFELRHEFVHDANSTTGIARGHIARLESLAIVLPQYVTMMFFATQVAAIDGSNTMPAMFLVEDFLATDWAIDACE